MCVCIEEEGGGERKTYNVIIRNTVRFAPCRHDKRIVGRKDDDVVHAGLLEGFLLLKEGGDVLLGAGGCEGAWNSDHNDLFVLELYIRGSPLA